MFGKQKNGMSGSFSGMTGRRVVWRTPSVSADGLKNFACVMMFIRTLGIAVVQNGLIHVEQYTKEGLSAAMKEDSELMSLAGLSSVLQLLGGLAVPIFVFLLVEGFLNTSSYRKYLLSMVIFAIISEVPYDLANYGRVWDTSGQNELFSMAVSLLMLYFLRMMEEKKGMIGVLLKALIVQCAVLWVTVLRAGGGLCVVLMAAVFYLFYSRSVLKTVLGALLGLLYVTAPLSFYGIWCYDGTRKNKLPKYAYYAFYPLHLLVLGVVSVMM